MRHRVAIVLLAAAVSAGAGVGQANANPPCGEIVGDAVLTGDLDCSWAMGWALIVRDGGSVNLAGHTLTGTPTYGTFEPELPFSGNVFGGGIQCLGSCTIIGGGGSIVPPPGLPERTRYSIGVFGEEEDRTNVITIIDTQISGWSGLGVLTQGSASLSGCTLSNNVAGVVASWRLAMDGCAVNNSSDLGAYARIGTVTNSSFDGNGQTAPGKGGYFSGLYVLSRLDLVNSTVTNSDEWGVFAKRLRATNSSIIGNCLEPRDNPSLFCADLVTQKRPRIVESNCNTSLRDERSEGDWGVCALD